jgi:hypothetical protein
MDDPLTVERDELLRMLEELDRFYAGLQGVEAGVLDLRVIELQQLRMRLENSKSPTKLKRDWEVAERLLVVAAAELIKLLFETLNYILAATKSRRRLYEDRRINQIPAWCFRAPAA